MAFRRTKSALSSMLGTESLRDGMDIVKAPLDLFTRERKGDDVNELKKLNFEELLNRWSIPLDGVPKLKKRLKVEIYAWAFIALLGIFYPILQIITASYAVYGLGMGILFIFVGVFNGLQKHHWLTILKNKKFITFREYLRGV